MPFVFIPISLLSLTYHFSCCTRLNDYALAPISSYISHVLGPFRPVAGTPFPLDNASKETRGYNIAVGQVCMITSTCNKFLLNSCQEADVASIVLLLADLGSFIK